MRYRNAEEPRGFLRRLPRSILRLFLTRQTSAGTLGVLLLCSPVRIPSLNGSAKPGISLPHSPFSPKFEAQDQERTETQLPGTQKQGNEAPSPGTRSASDELVVTAVGDIMLGSTYPDETGAELPPNDGADLLTEVTPILRLGDITFGNLEGPLIDGGTSEKCPEKPDRPEKPEKAEKPDKPEKLDKPDRPDKSDKPDKVINCFAFRVPTRYAKYLKTAGFSVVSLANNHALDFGAEGRESSRQALDALGIAHSGPLGDIAQLVVKGKKVTLLAFATYPGSYNLLDFDDAIQAVNGARARADFVIVSFHGGAEGAAHQHVVDGDEIFLEEDRGDLRRFAHAAVDAGAGLVIGHGPHVIRGMEIYKGRLIAYSLGNFATYGRFNLRAENGLSLILEAHLGWDGAFLGGRVHPIKQEKPGGPKLDADMAILPILLDLSLADFRGASIVPDDNGLLSPWKGEPDVCLDVPSGADRVSVKAELCGQGVP